jgi:hypothetical protein
MLNKSVINLALRRVHGIFGILLGQHVEPHPLADVCADGGYRVVKTVAVFWEHTLEDRAVFRREFTGQLDVPFGCSYCPDGASDVGDRRTCLLRDTGRGRGLDQRVICGGKGFRWGDRAVYHESCQL